MTMRLLRESGPFGIGSVVLAAALIAISGARVYGQGGGSQKPGGEIAGNNLSFPVIWAEGVTKTLPGTPDADPFLQGEWWYWWGTEGTDPNIIPLSAPPDPDDPTLCDDGIPGQAAGDPPGEPWVRAYLQKDPLNVWQAGSADWSAAPVNVHWIDWGDNLESVDWYMTSQVRTEVVLFQDLLEPMLEYEMRHVSGWGIDEVHGIAVDRDFGPIEGPGTRATVYSHCARLTIQKLRKPREEIAEGDLEWVPEVGWKTADPDIDPLVNPPIFNDAVYEGGDGPGYYSAEINVKGRVIYGYTWNVRRLNDDGAGDYRITFSFDADCGVAELNTFFTDEDTQILAPLEEELLVAALAEEEPTGAGAVAELDYGNNLTYIDVRIHEREKGGGGGGGGKTKNPPRGQGH